MDKKASRLMSIYNRLLAGNVINKAEEANRFKVTEKSIQRDLEDIRTYLAKNMDSGNKLIYDRRKRGYFLTKRDPDTLSNSEIFTVCKILLESRSMVKEEMMPIIDKLVKGCVPNDQQQKVSGLISNEKHHYLPPHHGRRFVENMWEMGNAVYERRLMRISYRKLKNPEPVTRLIQPVGIMFSEYYFYLCAYICQSEENPNFPKYQFPTTYRNDRIDSFEIFAICVLIFSTIILIYNFYILLFRR